MADKPITIITCRRSALRVRCSIEGCIREHTKLCDFPLKGRKAGKTCDKKLCDEHATKVGPDRDCCPAHASLTKRDQDPPVA